ncbi:MAG: DUF1993 family protein [Sphingobium sp.]
MPLMNLLAPTYLQMLKALSGWLTKAQASMPDDRAEALLTARLADDMFPLSTQVRFVCVQAQEGLYRLRGEAFPPLIDSLLNEGRDGGSQPGTIADARARIGETIAIVESLSSAEFGTDLKRPIVHILPDGTTFDMTAEQYVRDWALPQFYFHIMIAYAILRAAGVDLGKIDYVNHMFAYLRPGTFPGT